MKNIKKYLLSFIMMVLSSTNLLAMNMTGDDSTKILVVAGTEESNNEKRHNILKVIFEKYDPSFKGKDINWFYGNIIFLNASEIFAGAPMIVEDRITVHNCLNQPAKNEEDFDYLITENMSWGDLFDSYDSFMSDRSRKFREEKELLDGLKKYKSIIESHNTCKGFADTWFPKLRKGGKFFIDNTEKFRPQIKSVVQYLVDVKGAQLSECKIENKNYYVLTK